jgi:hypothetical protein
MEIFMCKPIQTVEGIVKENKLTNEIHLFKPKKIIFPKDRAKEEYHKETVEKLLNRINEEHLKCLNAFLKDKEEYIQHNLLTTLLTTPRMIINDLEGNYIALVNTSKLEKYIVSMFNEISYFPKWEKQLCDNGWHPIYLIFILETKSLLELFKKKKYFPYSIITIADYFEVARNMMKSFVENENNLKDVFHIFNYVGNQLHSNFKHMESNELDFLEGELLEQMRNVMVEEHRRK